MHDPIVFVTDFGRDDAYASALTGAAWRVDPRAVCVEGTHGVPPGDILGGAYHMKSLALAYATRAVLCAVVDPEVGTERRAIAVQVGALRCVAPDNGLVSYLWEGAPDGRRAVVLGIPDDAAATFAGRDVFAPAAARLAAGMRLEDCGEQIDDPVILVEAFAERLSTGLRGRVAVVDHFGNAITTIRDVDLGDARVRAACWPGGATATFVKTYAEIAEGSVAALVSSAGHVEIAARRGPASAFGGPGLGAAVSVELG